ncbi:MAG: branched-chain amino acid ABC transporter permease [Chloroflexi bacterium]|nr:branched-chain amino acid ABC transporter permease [Chloroflexota bacterium]MCC6892334.1 branched-chain amino acid ABC transporter permease [Anaerolineae bacterium]
MGQTLKRTLRENWLYALILIGLIAFPFIVGAITGSSPNGVPRGDRMIMRGESVRWQAVLIELFILSILAMSYNLMFGFTGVVSFGHALFFGLGGYILGLALEYVAMDTGVALVVGVLAGVAVCGVVGLLVGLVSLRLSGVYFAIFTLAIAEMFFIYFGRLPLTRAEDGFPITELPIWLDPAQSRLTFYYVALAFFVAVFLFIRRLMNSPTGAVFKAVRENEDRAQAIGYNTLRYKLIAIILAGMIAALAGMLQILLNKKVGPELLGISNTVNPLLMTIIGGIGTFTGPVVGASGLHLLDTILRESVITIGSLSIRIADVWELILGGIFMITVIIFPQGIVGTWQRRRGKRVG